MGLLLVAEEVLYPGARRRELAAKRDRLLGHDREALQQGGVAVGELAGRGQRAGAGEEELDALVRQRSLRQEAQRACEPACGSRGCARRDLLSGQNGDGGHVALARAALDVVCARWRGGAPRHERFGAALVRAQPPAAWRGLVDRPSHERVPEAKAAGHVGMANEVERQQLVESLHGRCLAYRRRGGRQLGLEWVACHRRPL